MKSYRATEGKVYVHKEKVDLYGELVIIAEGDPYTIQDFKQLTKESHRTQLEALYEQLATAEEVVEEETAEEVVEEETAEEVVEEEEEEE